MQILVTGTWGNNTQPVQYSPDHPKGSLSAREMGFTLIELLVVLFIIGILTSLIGLSITSWQDSSQRESRRFYQVLEAGRQQAVLFNHDLGVELTVRSYRVLRWQGQKWQPLGADVFAAHELPEKMQQLLWFNDLPQDIEPADSENPQPQILLFATGEVTPFRWGLKSQEEKSQWQLTASPVGFFELSLEPTQ